MHNNHLVVPKKENTGNLVKTPPSTIAFSYVLVYAPLPITTVLPNAETKLSTFELDLKQH